MNSVRLARIQVLLVLLMLYIAHRVLQGNMQHHLGPECVQIAMVENFRRPLAQRQNPRVNCVPQAGTLPKVQVRIPIAKCVMQAKLLHHKVAKNARSALQVSFRTPRGLHVSIVWPARIRTMGRFSVRDVQLVHTQPQSQQGTVAYACRVHQERRQQQMDQPSATLARQGNTLFPIEICARTVQLGSIFPMQAKTRRRRA